MALCVVCVLMYSYVCRQTLQTNNFKATFQFKGQNAALYSEHTCIVYVYLMSVNGEKNFMYTPNA